VATAETAPLQLFLVHPLLTQAAVAGGALKQVRGQAVLVAEVLRELRAAALLARQIQAAVEAQTALAALEAVPVSSF
jgi:hypothetical protein